MKLYYNLPELKNDLSIEISNPEEKFFTLIYGPNGIGKTSFANSISKNVNNKKIINDYEIKAFSRGYIHENVYINNQLGSKTETAHNQYWGDVF